MRISDWSSDVCSSDLLQSHQAVHYFSGRTGRNIDWSFMVDGKPVDVPVKGAISVNDSEAYVKCALEGFGMIQPGRYMVEPYLKSGALREVLTDWTPPPMQIGRAHV